MQPFNGFPFKDNCQYSAEGVVCKVPPNSYFMMGDHRDDSQDSRYWGFVPDENIVGTRLLRLDEFQRPEPHRLVPLIRRRPRAGALNQGHTS